MNTYGQLSVFPSEVRQNIYEQVFQGCSMEISSGSKKITIDQVQVMELTIECEGDRHLLMANKTVHKDAIEKYYTVCKITIRLSRDIPCQLPRIRQFTQYVRNVELAWFSVVAVDTLVTNYMPDLKQLTFHGFELCSYMIVNKTRDGPDWEEIDNEHISILIQGTPDFRKLKALHMEVSEPLRYKFRLVFKILYKVVAPGGGEMHARHLWYALTIYDNLSVVCLEE